jgi:hypothetical protein
MLKIIYSPVKAKSDSQGSMNKQKLRYITQKRPQMTLKWAVAFNCLIFQRLFTYFFDKNG